MNEAKEMTNVFKILSEIDITDFVEGFGSGDSILYINWAVAWNLTKNSFPDAEWEISEFQHDPNNPLKFPFLKTPQGFFVHGTVRIEGIAMSDWYDLEESNPSTANITKAHQRCLVKCLGRHGLGIRLWQKEKREEIKKRLNQNSPGKESTRILSTQNTALKSSAKPGDSIPLGQTVYNIPGKDPYKLNGKTFEDLGAASIADSLAFWKPKHMATHGGKIDSSDKIGFFITMAEKWLNERKGISDFDEPPPLDDMDLPWPKTK